MATACSIRVRGVVQGVGFRPFVYRLAQANALKGWVLNGERGVEIHLEGTEQDMAAFVREMRAQPPPAAELAEFEVEPALCEGLTGFAIRESERKDRPTVRVSPDLPVCEECLTELFGQSDRRYHYPYINCTNCGPRYSVIIALPYDRPNTTMRGWPMDSYCSDEYQDPANRRFHAQPVACPACGPNYFLLEGSMPITDGSAAITRAAQLLNEGKIVAIKGLGGYHLASDARNPEASIALRERKFRKEKPFAVMARDLEVARSLIHISSDTEALLISSARPIVLAPRRLELAGVAPENDELGVMLPYTPLQHLLFAAGAPEALVMTSANRSSEPIAYEDDDALDRLRGIADAFLVGERPIARRVDDSVACVGPFGPVILRRARGYAPGAVAVLPTKRPLLALGADLKNTITLVVDGQAFVSQHLGDLDHYQAFRAFEETVKDLVSMYDVRWHDLLLVHDCHPQYASTAHALSLPVMNRFAVQHHRAHVASVLAERGEWEETVVGVSLDGTGYGDDGMIWGGEIFVGSLQRGFQRVAHLRQASLPGGDAAAQYPMQAAAGFLSQLDDLPDLTAPPFGFNSRYQSAVQLVRRGVRAFPTTSTGRLFDTVAALLGFVREITFEGQAAIWLEQLARNLPPADNYPFPFAENELDFRPLLTAVIRDRLRGRPIKEIARSFQLGFAQGLWTSIRTICEERDIRTVVLSGGVFQNSLLLEDLKPLFDVGKIRAWTNHAVPSNDGGISLGQAAIAVFQQNANDGECYA
ncbi:carbamoyltransferase HypF [Alloacidobacterium dinghuense]|uniref:Carbamoyltransferase n=1 Tax=Alloacidobacterium dinghuense TaxID=2763107 RepID=A0A7G8BC98_9BACT|nr:carbamoyltransferase HypF [Alloacidobacterium dinghuense]QNI30168.1 carbamoyltransferase HypF [Alloacidobacterium dinghuense]